MKQSSLEHLSGFYVFALFLSILFVFTANPFTYDQAITRGFSDVIEYMAVANAPDFESLHTLSLTHALHRLERWPLHFAIGRLALLLNINIWELERIFVLFGMSLVFMLVTSLRASPGQKIAIYALLIFSPYAFRQYYAVPGMLSDCYFYVAILGMAVGMWRKQWALIVVSLCCACFIRQTGVLLLPIFAIYCFADKVSLSKALSILILGFLAFGLSKALSIWAFVPVPGGYVAMHTLGIFFWIIQNPQWLDLADFLGRYGLMLLSLSPVLLLVNRLSVRDWMYIGFFFFLHTQPLLAGPGVTGGNIDRLAIYGLPFLALILINDSQQDKFIGLIFIVLMFLESLLPNFSFLNGEINPRVYFVSVVLMANGITLWVRRSRSRKLGILRY